MEVGARSHVCCLFFVEIRLISHLPPAHRAADSDSDVAGNHRFTTLT
jgi:hypothetical protein